MTRLNLAIWYLNFMLMDDPIFATEIISVGIKLGFSKRTLRRAKFQMKIKSIKIPVYGKSGKWVWNL